METTLDAARLYSDVGLSFVPVNPRTKKPAARSWKRFQTERPAPAEWKRWFGRGNKNIGIVLGQVSGNVVSRDFDAPGSYARWAETHPDLARLLPTVKTGKGHHVYFRVQDVGEVQRRLGAGAYLVLPDGELRLQACQNVAPPSRHQSGHLYTWLVPLPSTLAQIPIVDPLEAGFLGAVPEPDQLRLPPTTKDTERCLLSSQLSQSSLSNRAEVQEAINKTLPTGPGQRHTCIFNLARHLKGIADLFDAPPKVLEPIVRLWHERALPFITTKPFEASWFAFLEGWDKVLFPAAANPLAQILEKSVASECPKAAQKYEQPQLRLLVAICREFQRTVGDKPFFLSCRTAGRLIGVEHGMANYWLNGLLREDILALVVRGTQNRAARYKYLPDLNA